MKVILDFNGEKVVVEGVEDFKEFLSHFNKKEDKVKKLYEEFPNVVTCTLTIHKPEGRFRPYVQLSVVIDEEFYKKYNPSVGSWLTVPYFKRYYFAENEDYMIAGSRDDFYGRVGFKLYTYKNPEETGLRNLDRVFYKLYCPPCLELHGYLSYKENLRGIEDYQVELNTLIEIAKSAKETVLKNCLEAYMSPEINTEMDI